MLCFCCFSGGDKQYELAHKEGPSLRYGLVVMDKTCQIYFQVRLEMMNFDGRMPIDVVGIFWCFSYGP
jgi:hypothetical protein